MPWMMPAAVIGSGLLQGESSRNAANASAQAQLQAAQIAADAAKFRPVGVTSRYGTSQFTTDAQGNLVGAGYNVSPEYQAYQNQISGLLGQQLQQGLGAQQQYAPLQTAAGGLFNLGQGYLAQSPEQAAQKFMESQQALLAPSRERESALLANQLSNTGRTGLSVAQGGGLLSANPEQAALANARAMQDLALASQATQAGQQQTAFGAGLFGTGANLLGSYQQGQVGALNPFQTSLGVQSGIEQLGQQPLTLGAGLGGQSAAYGANAGRFITQGAQAAAPMQFQANAYNPYANILQGFGTNPAASQGLGRAISGGIDSLMNPYTVDTSGAGMGSWGSVDTSLLPAGSFR
ncbi:hypothetical protein EBT25_01280 [bacterium]|nr:hypothetical protein [bacterium]